MTRIRVPAPDIEADVSALDVVAYLLRPGSEWTREPDASEHWYTFTRGLLCVNVPRSAMVKGGRRLTECIHDIARAEGRHPSAVLADIVGPARAASVGAACYSDASTFEAAEARFECKARMGLVKWMTNGNGAAHGAGKSEEQKR